MAIYINRFFRSIRNYFIFFAIYSGLVVNCTTVRPQIVESGKRQIEENTTAIKELEKLPQTPEIKRAIQTLERSSETIAAKESHEIELGTAKEKAEQLAEHNQTAANHWSTLLWVCGSLVVVGLGFGALKLFKVF